MKKRKNYLNGWKDKNANIVNMCVYNLGQIQHILNEFMDKHYPEDKRQGDYYLEKKFSCIVAMDIIRNIPEKQLSRILKEMNTDEVYANNFKEQNCYDKWR